jgi:hypothetical protein
MGTATSSFGFAGTQTEAIAVGGSVSPQTQTQEYTDPTLAVQKITTS